MALVGVVLAVGLLGACGGGGGDDGAPGRLTIVASFYPLAEAAGRIAGEDGEVVNLTPAGTEPHDLELSPAQVDRLQAADLVVYMGQGFQPALEDVVERRRGPKLDVAGELPLDRASVPEGGDGGDLDPHFWLDPTLMAKAVESIEKALARAQPRSRAELERNGAAYRAELQELDREYAQGLATCQRRELVTSHAAFHYLARRYGLVQEPIAGVSPEAEPDPQRLAAIADLVRRRGVTTIFSETLASPEVSRTIARETGAKTAVLDPIEGLGEDQLARGASYSGVMRENLATLREALGCR